MANVDVTLRRFNGTDWDFLFPKTTVDQITDKSVVGGKLLKATSPNANSFIQIDDAGNVSFIGATTLKTLLQASSIGHTHPTSQITGLDTALSGKADLTEPGGVILSTQIPQFLFSGLRFINSKSGTVTTATLKGEISGDTEAGKTGGYFVATAPMTITLSSGHSIVYGGDDGGETATGTILEKGDWFVYAGNNTWSVVNNTYRLANKNSRGVVSLSAGTATLRSQLDNTALGDGTKVVDESALKKVMKDIFYQSTLPSAGQAATGDLLFQGTFS